jgi:trans-aconitate methyltransferase
MRPDIAFLPTPNDAVDALLDLADVQPQDVVYDLGCGDGRILIRASQRWGTQGVGIDIDPICIAGTQATVTAAGLSHLISLRCENLYESDLRSATVVVLYLLPHLNMRLRPRLQHQLRSGARIVSHQFDMGDWQPDRTIHLPESEEDSVLYLWTIF